MKSLFMWLSIIAAQNSQQDTSTHYLRAAKHRPTPTQDALKWPFNEQFPNQTYVIVRSSNEDPTIKYTHHYVGGYLYRLASDHYDYMRCLLLCRHPNYLLPLPQQISPPCTEISWPDPQQYARPNCWALHPCNQSMHNTTSSQLLLKHPTYAQPVKWSYTPLSKMTLFKPIALIASGAVMLSGATGLYYHCK